MGPRAGRPSVLCLGAWGGVALAALVYATPAAAQLTLTCGTTDIDGTPIQDFYPDGIDGCPGQPGRVDPQMFQWLPGGGTTFTVDRPTVHRHMSFVLGLGLDHAFAPLVSVDDDSAGGATHEVVSGYTQIDLMAAIGLFEVMELGLAVPIVSANVAFDPNADRLAMPDGEYELRRQTSLGDVRFALKVPLLRGDFALAARLAISVPTASATTGGNVDFLGSRGWGGMPALVASVTAGKLTLTGELGWHFRRRAVLAFDTRGLEQDDELMLAAGGAFALSDAFALLLESHLRVGVGGRTGLGGETIPANEVPLDLNAGVRWRATQGVVLEAGAGTGLAAGYGSAAARLFLAARYETEREACPAGPEDYDGYEDGDYCADPDNDRDRLDDDDDLCPNDREDADRFADDDGCPDSDNDADGVLDGADRCANESEDRDGFRDEDGCPEPDNDEDGVPDGLDGPNGECANEPEDRDSFQDDDGCPEPGPTAITVSVTDTRILVSERIYFDFDRDTIRSVSMPLLDQVAAVIRDIPANRRIRVEGYSDNQGEQRYNVDLSYRRARAVVEYLSAHGVPRERLDYVGFGAERPVAPNDSPEGQALNRRVEFIILDPPEGGGRRRER